MSRPTPKPIKVVWRKLGKEKVWGRATIGAGLVEVDPRMTARRQLEVLIHEVAHHCHPDMSEGEVDRAGKMISEVLWAENYRRVALAPNAKLPRGL